MKILSNTLEEPFFSAFLPAVDIIIIQDASTIIFSLKCHFSLYCEILSGSIFRVLVLKSLQNIFCYILMRKQYLPATSPVQSKITAVQNKHNNN
jgi:hypothetical protein